MRFQISTCLLVIALFAVILGWVRDRADFDKKLVAAVKTQELVSSIEDSIDRKEAIEFSGMNREQISNADRLMVVGVISLFESAEAVDELSEISVGGSTSDVLLYSLLFSLNIDTSDEYFEVLSSLLTSHGIRSEKYSAYVDTETRQHQALRDFIEQE